jgi:phenylalanyl-tRNA synthetase beta chain
MRAPLAWLKQLIPIEQPPLEIAKMLTMLGLEVEAIEEIKPAFEGVIVGKVIATERHPNADSLVLASVSDGKEIFQVVCGAPNCREGLKTAFAPVGASVLGDDGKMDKIKRAKIRGIESFGMLCSGKELHLSDESEGILELDDAIAEGSDFAGLCRETVFEIGLTPNLGHCSNMVGVARELAAAGGLKVSKPEPEVKEDAALKVKELATVRVDDPELCPRYTARVIQGVKIGPSPQWLQSRLELCGVRSINNVVDATNYVLLELGQPLHAFDYDQLAGHEIIVRKAKEGEKITLLDGKERVLNSENLVIADQKEAVALAGIMGGSAKEVSDKTVNVLLESAYFNPRNIRRSSKKLGIQTDASKRYERGADPNLLITALDRATELILQIAGGKAASGVIEVTSGPFPEKVIRCRVKRVDELLGVPLSGGEIETIFQRLGFECKAHGQDEIQVTVPTYRADITAEVDLIEEVARIYGYHNIMAKETRFETSTMPSSPIFLFEREVRNRLIAEGLQEFETCDLIGPTSLAYLQKGTIREETLVKVMNPTSIEQSVLRPSLLPGLLELLKYNFDHENHDISGFEVGRIHLKEGDQYKEQSVAGVILSGKSRQPHWDVKPADDDFYDLKGIIENIFQELGIEQLHFEPSHLNIFHSGRQASIIINQITVGSLGEIHPALVRKLDVPQRIYYAEFNLHDLIPLRRLVQKMVPLPIYPASERDWTITLKEETTLNEIQGVLSKIKSTILEKVTLLDIYRSDRLGKEKKNVTLHFVYRDPQKTLSQEEVDAEHAHVTQQALQLLGKQVI